MKTYKCTGELNDHVKARLNRSDGFDCYVNESGDIILKSSIPFADLSGLREVFEPSAPTPICETCQEPIDIWGCGFECSHPDVAKYRMTPEEILWPAEEAPRKRK